MTRTGLQLVTDSLREIRVLDPIEVPNAEQEADAIRAATEVVDAWRVDKLFIRGVTRSVYSLTTNTQNYTIGPLATFAQDYPSDIPSWSVIPDDDAADPVEQPRGRPLTYDEWQQVRVKSQTGAYPNRMFWNRLYDANGRSTLSFHPIPNNGDVDVVLYSHIPQITSIVSGTSYDLPPAYGRALRLAIALELADRYGKKVTDRLERKAMEAIGRLKRANIKLRESPLRPEFAIGHGRGSMNIYTGS